jgi:hypothetical protein
VSDWDPDLDGDDDLDPPIAPSQYHTADTELLLQQLRDLIDSAPNVPLSSTPRVSREEVLDLLDEAIVRFPDELKAARWLLKEKEEFLAKMQHEADAVLDQARARVERMVQRTEVVKAAETRAYQILDTAEAEARRLRHEVEDFCDQKLASFEIVLERTMKMVASGRAKLQGTNLTADIPLDSLDDEDGGYDDEFDGDFDEEGAALADLPPPPGDLFRRDG